MFVRARDFLASLLDDMKLAVTAMIRARRRTELSLKLRRCERRKSPKLGNGGISSVEEAEPLGVDLILENVTRHPAIIQSPSPSMSSRSAACASYLRKSE
jgi:hypothetical protein